MSSLFEDKKVDLKSWSIDELYNEWEGLSYLLTRCLRDREFASQNQTDITRHREELERELENKGYKWEAKQ